MTSRPDYEPTIIHFKDLIRFLAERRPSQKCSVCGYDQGWKFHAESKPKESNPIMTVFELPVAGDTEQRSWVESVCIECPHCANMDFLGAASILQFLEAGKQSQND